MKVSDIMTTNIVSCTADTPLSQVMGKMKQNRIHQMPVIDNGILAGMVELRNILSRDLDPGSAKAKTVMTSTASILPDVDADDALKALLKNGGKALPVAEDNEVLGLLSETDLLGLVTSSEPIEDVLTKSEYAAPSDDLGKIEHIMRYNNVSRVPIVDKGAVAGVIGTLDLIDIYMKGKERFRAQGTDSGNKDKMPVYKIPAGAVMKPAVMINKKEKVSKVAALLKSSEHVVAYDMGTVYMVTPKDVLETLQRQNEEGVPVQVTHLNEDPITEAKVNKILTECSQRIMKLDPAAGTMNIYVETHNGTGDKKKYSMRARISTPKGLFVAHKWGWGDLASVVQDLTDTLEKELLKKYNRDRTQGKKAGESRKG